MNIWLTPSLGTTGQNQCFSDGFANPLLYILNLSTMIFLCLQGKNKQTNKQKRDFFFSPTGHNIRVHFSSKDLRIGGKGRLASFVQLVTVLKNCLWQLWGFEKHTKETIFLCGLSNVFLLRDKSWKQHFALDCSF